MRAKDIIEGVGRITKQNQTVDVGPDEVTKQAAKFGNKVDKDGRPPTLSKRVKGKSTNVLFNLGLAEGYKLQLERDKEMLVLHIKDTTTGKRTEVRGKTGYESGNYDSNDRLHKLLDKLGKSVDISQLMNGEPVGINPNHAHGEKAKTATNKAYSETYTRDQLPQIKNSQLKNIKHTLETVAINTIIPVQEERIIENFKRQVDKIVAGNYKPIIVDCDNKIVNGHHRYTALQMLEYKEVQIARLPWTLEQILDEGQAINNPKNTFLTKSDTAYDFLRVGKTISNLSTAKKSDNRDEPDVMIVPFGGKKEKDHLKKGLKKSGYKTQDADKPGDDAHVDENFADGKKKGKSRPGRVKRSGASCNGSVTALRKRAKNASGEKAKMYHWCANMKGGKKK